MPLQREPVPVGGVASTAINRELVIVKVQDYEFGVLYAIPAAHGTNQLHIRTLHAPHYATWRKTEVFQLKDFLYTRGKVSLI